MSRCFPFPPPGYEKKARNGDLDLLKKEKQREKKPKKEKDKEKRESKEKKEKDRSDEKHREKKDKREKHREKKEDRDKDKDKFSNLDERRLKGKSEGHDGGKTSNEKKLPPNSEGNNGEKFIQKDKEKNRCPSSISSEKKVAGQFSGYGGEKLNQNSYLAGDSKDSKYVLELGRRFRDEDRATGNQLVENSTGTDRKRDEEVVRLVANATPILGVRKEKLDKRGGNERKLDEQGVRDDAMLSGRTMVQSLSGVVQTKPKGVPRPVEREIESKTEGKEMAKQKEQVDKWGNRHKDKDREKKSQGKDKDRDKEKKKEEKAEMKSELKSMGKDILKDKKKDDLLGAHIKTLPLPNDGNKNAIGETNIRKRKDSDTNGLYHANDSRPNKLLRRTSAPHSLMETDKLTRLISSPHPLTGNGKILQPGQTSALFTSDRQGSANNCKADNKEHKVNGMISSQPLSVSTAMSLFMTEQADQIAEVSLKSPHPHTKYLNQILSVPKREEFSKDHDLEWLIHCGNFQSQKPKVICPGDNEIPEVWAEAMRIESADVCALPYVVPF